MAGGARLEADHTCLFKITPATTAGSGMILSATGANSVSLLGATKTHFVSLADDVGNWSGDGDAAHDLGALASSPWTRYRPTAG